MVSIYASGLLIIGTVCILSTAFLPIDEIIVRGISMSFAGGIGVFIPVLGTPLPLAVMTVIFGILTYKVYNEYIKKPQTSFQQTSDAESLHGKYGTVTEKVTPTSNGSVRLDNSGFSEISATTSVNKPIPEGDSVIVSDPQGGSVVKVVPIDER